MEQTFRIAFHERVWSDEFKHGIPNQSGIYCVYEGSVHTAIDSVVLHKLIYIGESHDVRGRLANHEKLQEWKDYVRPGYNLCYSFASVEEPDRVRTEAAFINKHKPPVNTEYVDAFPFHKTSIHAFGVPNLIHPAFTVHTS